MTARLKPVSAILLALLTAACGEVEGEGELDAATVPTVDAAPPVLDAAPAPLGDAAALVDAALVTPAVDCLEHPVAACGGQWADNSNRDTRYIAHPVTGKATFACTWTDPRCDAPWYADRRCTAAYDIELASVCADVGGRCEVSSGVPYCVAAAGL